MLSLGSFSGVQRCAFLGAAIFLGAAMAQAQTGALSNSFHDAAGSSESASYSSSGDFSVPDFSSAAPAASPANGGGQYDNRSGAGRSRRRWAFETGAGFNAPIGNDIPYITWGANFTIGGGMHFSREFALLAEYQFIADKLPGALVAAGGGDTGNAHIQSITATPILDLMPKHTTGVYLVGGGGWYYKSTNWNVLVGYDFYGYPVYATANSFSSNQFGVSGGFGLSHRMGGVYGDGTAKLFAEARYLWIDTPRIGEPNGLGTTGLIPVTIGVRW
jgi:hypothetical protein